MDLRSNSNDASMETGSLWSTGHASKLIIFYFYQNGWCPQAQLFSQPPLSVHHFVQYLSVRIPQGSVFTLNTLSPLAPIHAPGFNSYLYSKSFQCMHTAKISPWSSGNACINVSPSSLGFTGTCKSKCSRKCTFLSQS